MKASVPLIVTIHSPGAGLGRPGSRSGPAGQSITSTAAAMPERDPGEQVGGDHAERGDQVGGQFPVPGVGADLGQADQPQADHDQHGGQHGERDRLQQAGEEQHEQRDPHAVQDRRGPGPRAGRHVGRAAHDDAGDRQAAEQAGDGVRGALGDQLPVELGARAVVQPVDRDRGEQRLDAGDQRDGEHGQGDLRAAARPASAGRISSASGRSGRSTRATSAPVTAPPRWPRPPRPGRRAAARS